jgi:hypothetical protein
MTYSQNRGVVWELVPCRDDSTLGFRDIRENDRNFETACNSNGIDANFAVIEAIIDSFERGASDRLEETRASNGLAMRFLIVSLRCY